MVMKIELFVVDDTPAWKKKPVFILVLQQSLSEWKKKVP